MFCMMDFVILSNTDPGITPDACATSGAVQQLLSGTFGVGDAGVARPTRSRGN